MINKVAKKSAQAFIKNNTRFQNVEIYEYAFFIMLSTIVFLVYTIIIGTVLNVMLESVLFYFLFMLIRMYAGGYHASKETTCDIITSLSILVCVVLIRLSKTYDFQILIFVITMFSALCILVLSPLDTPEKPLTDKEYCHYRKISWSILLIISAVVLVSFIFKWKALFFPSCLSLILESILLIAGKVKRVYQLKNVEQ